MIFAVQYLRFTVDTVDTAVYLPYCLADTTQYLGGNTTRADTSSEFGQRVAPSHFKYKPTTVMLFVTTMQ